jgi:hypothetical protein
MLNTPKRSSGGATMVFVGPVTNILLEHGIVVLCTDKYLKTDLKELR